MLWLPTLVFRVTFFLLLSSIQFLQFCLKPYRTLFFTNMALQNSAVASLMMGNLSLEDQNSTKLLSQSPLLTLPPEVRDLIYETVLTTSLPRPQNPTDRGRLQRLNSVKRKLHGCAAWYPIKPVPNPAGSLLSTCRQIRHEIIGLFSRFEKTRYQNSRYELDIIILAEQTLYPTWLLVPLVPSELTSQVWADIRIAGSLPRSSYYCSWQGSDYGIPSFVWGLFIILNQFLSFGATFSDEDLGLVNNEPAPLEHSVHLRPRSQPIKQLRLLVLNVVTPTEAEMEGKPFIPADTRLVFRNAVEGVTHPQLPSDFLEDFVSKVVYRGVYSAEYFQLVYERVKVIKLCLDGEERCSWNVAEKTKHNPRC
jgi:hypothetical protein